MLKNVLKKSLKNYLFSILSIVVMTGLGLIATPFIIKLVGKSHYGVYQLILQFIGYLTICDLGLSTSSCALLSTAWEKKDRKYIIQTIKLILKQYLKIIPLIIFSIFLISYIFFNFSIKEYNQDIITSFFIMSLCSLLMPFNVFKDFLQASENSYLISNITTIQLFIMTILNIAFSYYGLGLVGLSISFSIMLIFFQLAIFFFSFRKIIKTPILNLKFHLIEKYIWSLNIHSFTQNILGRLSLATDIIVLSFFMPPVAVTYFLTNQKLAILIDSILKRVGNSSWASVVTLKRNKKELQRAIIFFNKLFILIGLPALFSLALHNKEFIYLWLGEDFYISSFFTWISFLNFALLGILSFWGWIFIGLGKIHLQTKAVFISGLVNIILSLILTYYYKEIGPVLGTFISFYGLYVWHMAFIMKKHLGLYVFPSLILFFKVIFALILLFPFLKYFFIFKGHSWWSFIINGIITYLLSLAVVLPIIVTKDDFLRLKTLLKNRK